MKKKRDAIIATAAVGCMYGFAFIHCNISDFASGVAAGLATVIVAVMWYDV